MRSIFLKVLCSSESMHIPILQAKFYYIPPLEGRFQTFLGIDIWHSIPHCSTMRNWSIPHVWGIEIVSTVENWNHAISIPHVWRIEIQKFCVQYGNVSPSPRRKRDWVKFSIRHSRHILIPVHVTIFPHLWLSRLVVKKKVPTTCGFATRGRNFFSPRLLSHAVRKNCDLAQEWECAFRDSWGIFISPLVASPRRGEISHPFFSSVKDWVNYILSLLYT